MKEGEVLIDSALIGDWWNELITMNSGKEGRPFEYPDTFFRWVSLLRTIFQRPYRQLEGFLRGLSKYLPIPYVPSYQTIFRRLNKQELDLAKAFEAPSKETIIAVDSSGIKVANRSDWIRHKWKIKRGWLKLHVAVDVKSHRIIDALVTTEETGDPVVAEYFIKEITKQGRFRKLLADGAYDKNTIFDTLKAKKVEPAIRTRKNASTMRGSKLRREEVRMKHNLGEEKWKQMKQYGQRWNVEIWFSAYKRRFGQQVKAVLWKNMVAEIMRNVTAMNWIYKMRSEL